MARDAAELLREALDLPAEVRAALADSILESLDNEVDDNVAEQWRDEIRKRLEEIDRGAVEMVAWPDARDRLRARLRR